MKLLIGDENYSLPLSVYVVAFSRSCHILSNKAVNDIIIMVIAIISKYCKCASYNYIVS